MKDLTRNSEALGTQPPAPWAPRSELSFLPCLGDILGAGAEGAPSQGVPSVGAISVNSTGQGGLLIE